MNTEQAYINGFVKRAAEYGFNEREAIKLLKQSGIADAPAYQANPTLSEGLHNAVGNIRKAVQQPNSINPINASLMTGSGGTPSPGIGGIPTMAKNLYSHLNPSGGTPTIQGINQQSNKVLSNMAEGLWNTPVNK
jgi:hypothetical protein